MLCAYSTKAKLYIRLRMTEGNTIEKVFKGPSHWNRTRGEWIPYTKPEILHATMEWDNTIYDILNGNLRVSVSERNPHTIFLYFRFDYIQDGIRKSGRWYDCEVSPTLLKEITNDTLTYIMNDFKDHDISEEEFVCTTRITFRPTVASWLRTLGETRPPPTLLNTVVEYWNALCVFCTTPLCSCSCR